MGSSLTRSDRQGHSDQRLQRQCRHGRRVLAGVLCSGRQLCCFVDILRRQKGRQVRIHFVKQPRHLRSLFSFVSFCGTMLAWLDQGRCCWFCFVLFFACYAKTNHKKTDSKNNTKLCARENTHTQSYLILFISLIFISLHTHTHSFSFKFLLHNTRKRVCTKK